MEKKPKFKVGDRVKVIKIVTDTDFRDEFIGEKFTIESINPNKKSNKTGIHYGVEDCLYIFFESELELVKNSFWIHKPCNVRSFFALECSCCHKTLYASGISYPYCPYCGEPMERPAFTNENRVSSEDINTDF